MRNAVAVLAAFGLMGCLAGPALAQAEAEKSCCTVAYITEGKHAVRKEFCEQPFKAFESMMVEVPFAEVKAGDAIAYKTVGKHAEKVYLREVPRVPAKPGHECMVGYVTVKKTAEYRMLCEINGEVALTCPGMNGEKCIAQK